MSKRKKLNPNAPSTPPQSQEEDAKLQDDSQAILRYMRERAARRPFYLASALESYKQAEGLDEAGLAVYLGIEQTQLTRLALCGRPDVNQSAEFNRDVKALAVEFNFKPLLLAKLLRIAAVYEANQQNPAGANRFLMAALDREDDAPAIGDEEDND